MTKKVNGAYFQVLFSFLQHSQRNKKGNQTTDKTTVNGKTFAIKLITIQHV